MNKGIKPIARKRDDFGGDNPLVIVECECGATTVARTPQAQTLDGWRVEWPSKTQKMMRVKGLCPQCANTRE